MLAAFCLKVDAGRISEARVAFGGMAGIPKRAKAIEEKLRGLSLERHAAVGNAAAEAVSKDFTPLTDLRASAAYRSRVAGNLVIKAIAEIAGVSPGITRIADHRMVADAAECAVSEAPLRHVYKPLPHDSGAKHVQGAAEYIDDMPEPVGTLHIAVGGSPVARGTHPRPRSCRGAERAGRRRRRHRGATYRERTTFRRRTPTSRCSRMDRVDFPRPAGVRGGRHVARCRAARGAARRDRDRCRSSRTFPSSRARRPASACCPITPSSTATRPRRSPRRRCRSAGTFHIGGQEHFYLEGQVALAVPGEDGAVLVYSSTQHPSEVQHVVARVLGAAATRS